MRRWLAAVGVACALGWAGPPAVAQPTSGPGPGPGAGTAPIPGQIVSNAFNLPSAGTAIKRAAPQAGTPIGSPLMRPYDPSKPYDVFKGTNLDASMVVGPVSGFPGLQTQQPDLLDRLYDKISSITHFFKPTSPTPPRLYTPGISRRNQERKERAMWRRD
jgi:hypothetical protein